MNAGINLRDRNHSTSPSLSLSPGVHYLRGVTVRGCLFQVITQSAFSGEYGAKHWTNISRLKVRKSPVITANSTAHNGQGLGPHARGTSRCFGMGSEWLTSVVDPFQQKLGGFPLGLPRCARLNTWVPRVMPHARNSMATTAVEPSSTPNTPATKTHCWLTEID